MTNAKITGSARIGGRGVGGSGSWRGLSLYNANASNVTGAVCQTYDTILKDTDGIFSAGPFTFGGVTVTACGVVPVGMAGPWRLSDHNNFSRVDSAHVESHIVVNADLGYFYAAFADAVLPDQFDLSSGPTVIDLAEGDTVWVIVFPATDTIDAGAGATLLMEYLGPALAEPS